MKERDGKEATSIHDLPEDCLVRVLSLVGHAALPIARPSHRDLVVRHPLQCALVCRRWRACARASVRTLHLASCGAERHLAVQARHFSSLRELRLAGGTRYPAVLGNIASATPDLERLVLDWTCRCPLDVAHALRAWTRVKHLALLGGLFGIYKHMQDSLLQVLPKLTNVESLALMYDGLDPDLTWESLSPHMTAVRELALQCTSPPSPSFPSSSFSTLRLRLTSLPRHVTSLVNVVDLHLVALRGDDTLQPELGSMRGLQSLTVERADSLATLPASLGQLSALTSLKLCMCESFSLLPPETASLPALRDLSLISCRRLSSLPDGFGRLGTLREIHLKDLPLLRALPESLVTLTQLSRLALEELPALAALPAGIGRLRALRELRLARLDNCSSLPGGLGDLGSSLERIEIVQCGVCSLPETLGRLSSLTHLRIAGCDFIQDLPESMCDLSKLAELHIERCEVLFSLPLGLARLTSLRELVVRNCKYFNFHNDSIPRMRSLRFLGLAGCKHQNCLPFGWERIQTLRMIRCSPGMIERAGRTPEGSAMTLEPDLGAEEIEVGEDDSDEDGGSGQTDSDHEDFEECDCEDEEGVCGYGAPCYDRL